MLQKDLIISTTIILCAYVAECAITATYVVMISKNNINQHQYPKYIQIKYYKRSNILICITINSKQYKNDPTMSQNVYNVRTQLARKETFDWIQSVKTGFIMFFYYQ